MKRLQVNVNKNVSQGLKEIPKTTIKSGINKRIHVQTQSDCMDKSKLVESQNEESSRCDFMKFKSKIIEIVPNEVKSSHTVIAPQPKSFRYPAVMRRINMSPSVSVKRPTETPRIKNRPQIEFDDVETTLARITSSQRAICITIDSLM